MATAMKVIETNYFTLLEQLRSKEDAEREAEFATCRNALRAQLATVERAIEAFRELTRRQRQRENEMWHEQWNRWALGLVGKEGKGPDADGRHHNLAEGAAINGQQETLYNDGIGGIPVRYGTELTPTQLDERGRSPTPAAECCRGAACTTERTSGGSSTSINSTPWSQRNDTQAEAAAGQDAEAASAATLGSRSTPINSMPSTQNDTRSRAAAGQGGEITVAAPSTPLDALFQEDKPLQTFNIDAFCFSDDGIGFTDLQAATAGKIPGAEQDSDERTEVVGTTEEALAAKHDQERPAVDETANRRAWFELVLDPTAAAVTRPAKRAGVRRDGARFASSLARKSGNAGRTSTVPANTSFW